MMISSRRFARLRVQAASLPAAPILKRCLDSLWFQRAQRRGTFAEHHEDRFALDFFGGRPGLYLDVGASHPFKGSNTHLLYRQGWDGLAIEPIAALAEMHRRMRPLARVLNAAAGAQPGRGMFHELIPSGWSSFDSDAADSLVSSGLACRRSVYPVPVVRIADAWAAEFGSREIDFMSVDAEGFEVEVLGGVDWKSAAPKLVCVEVRTVVEDKDRSEVIEFMLDQGYARIADLGVNVFFERPA